MPPVRSRKDDLEKLYRKRRKYWARRFHLGRGQRRDLTQALIDQLEKCKDESARLVLMGQGRCADDDSALSQRYG